MVVSKLINHLSWNSLYQDPKFNKNLMSYFKGEIDFEDLEITKSHKLDEYDAIKIIKKAINNVEEINNSDIVSRAIFYGVRIVADNDKEDLFKRLNADLIIKHYPNFFNEAISKKEYIENVFKSFRQYNMDKFITKIKEEECLKEELLEFIKNNPLLKTNGYYNSSSHNLLCFYKFDAIKESYENKDFSKTMDLVLEYLDILTDDYYFKYYSDDNKTWKGRTTLSKEGKKALLDIIKEGKDFEKNINILNKELKQKEGVRERKYFALLQDDSFQLLFKYLKESHVEAEYTNNLLDLANELNPEDRIKELYFKTCKDGCSFSDLDKVIEELEREEKNLSEKERDSLRTYVVTYTIEHYNCKKVVHEKLAKELIQRYGAYYITKYFKPKGRPDKLMGIEIFSRYTEDRNFQQLRENLELELIDNLLDYIAVEGNTSTPLSNRDNIKKYVLGESKKIDIKKSIIKKVDGNTIYKNTDFYILSQDKKDRLVSLVLETKNKTLINWLIYRFEKMHETFPHKELIEAVVKSKIDTKVFLRQFIEHSYNWRESLSYNGEFRYIDKYFKENILRKAILYLYEFGIDILTIGAKFPAKFKQELLEVVLMGDKVLLGADILIDFLGEKQKGVYTKALMALKDLQESQLDLIKKKVFKELKDYKGLKESMAIEVICHHVKDKEFLEKLLNKAKEPKSRDILSKALNLDAKDMFKAKDGDFNLDRYLKKVYKEKKRFPINMDKITLPVRKDGKDSSIAAKQFILSYKASDEVSINKEAIMISEHFTDESLKIFAFSIYEYWFTSQNIKDKWLLLIPTIHGDHSLIREIEKYILKLADMGRQKLSCYIIKALGLNGSREAFLIIDKIGRTTKYKTLRKASDNAFEIASRELGINPEEFYDQLVGNMGFVDNKMSFSYGDKDLKLFIGNDFKFKIEKADGKVSKSLPKLSKDFDEKIYKEANNEFKQLKKELKEMITAQTARMENALTVFRKWEASKWQELFLKNPIMNRIGSRLIWGIYDKNKLIKSFAFDTDLYDEVFESFELNKGDKIAIVHPLDLSDEEISTWTEVIEDNEVELLFNQLVRDILVVDNDKKLEFSPKDYGKKSPGTIINRARKKKWNIGSVRDAGSFDEIYKEVQDLNLGIEITFDDSPWVGGYGYEANSSEIGIKKIEFYKLGVISRGSYDYDELENHDGLRIAPKDLNKRLVSDLLYEIKNLFK